MRSVPPLDADTPLGPTPIDDPFLSVLIPVFNEERTLEQVVRRVAKLALRKEIIIIDDGSTDNSGYIAAALARDFSATNTTVTALTHSRNLGKGAAVRSGISASIGSIVLIQDADLEYDPADLPALLEPLLSGHADVVYGSRFSGANLSAHISFYTTWATSFLLL